MWFDLSPVLHTSWRAFTNALRDEFGTTPDDAEIHYAMTNAIKRAKETVTEYCFQDDEVKSQDQSRDAEIMMVMPSDKPGDESSAVLQTCQQWLLAIQGLVKRHEPCRRLEVFNAEGD
ncbi:hypothetical protein ACLKA7_001761 [Drosophila subpalustris]